MSSPCYIACRVGGGAIVRCGHEHPTLEEAPDCADKEGGFVRIVLEDTAEGSLSDEDMSRIRSQVPTSIVEQ